jgi:hypothetical protein
MARLRSVGPISFWSACAKSFIERTISAMRDSPSATSVSAGGISLRRSSTFSSGTGGCGIAACSASMYSSSSFTPSRMKETLSLRYWIGVLISCATPAARRPMDSSRSLEAMRSSAALRSVMSKPVPTTPVRWPSASCSGTLEVRITRFTPRVLS